MKDIDKEIGVIKAGDSKEVKGAVPFKLKMDRKTKNSFFGTRKSRKNLAKEINKKHCNGYFNKVYKK